MGIDPMTMFAISAATQIGSGLMQYSQQKRADSDARNAANAQANIMESDAAVASNQEKIDAENASRIQKMAYLSSGVTLEGSPLLTMQETLRKGDSNAANVTSSAEAKANLTRQQGSITRANLAGTMLETAGGVAQSYTSAQLLKRQLAPANDPIIWNK